MAGEDAKLAGTGTGTGKGKEMGVVANEVADGHHGRGCWCDMGGGCLLCECEKCFTASLGGVMDVRYGCADVPFSTDSDDSDDSGCTMRRSCTVRRIVCVVCLPQAPGSSPPASPARAPPDFIRPTPTRHTTLPHRAAAGACALRLTRGAPAWSCFVRR